MFPSLRPEQKKDGATWRPGRGRRRERGGVDGKGGHAGRDRRKGARRGSRCLCCLRRIGRPGRLMTETGGAGECAAGRSGQPDGTGKRCRAGEGATSRTRRKGEQTGAGAEREADTLMAGGNALELHGPIAGAEKAARNMRPPFWSFGCGKLFPVRRERHALLHLLMLPFGDIAGGKRSRCR